MKKKLVALLTLVTFLIMSIQFPVMAQGEVVGNVEPTRKILVKLNNAKRRSMLNHQSNLNLGKKIKDDIYQVEVNSEALEELLENEEIEYIEEDSIVVKAGDITTWNIEKIQAPKIKEEGYTGKGIKVAVFDTGIDLNNTDLKVAGGASFVDGVSSYNDDNGHGTAMAGVLCALENQQGLLGAAPEIELYSVKVLDQDGYGLYSNIIQGIDWAIANDIDIITMSFGGVQYSRFFEEAITEAINNNILLIAASGNDGNTEMVHYPAGYSDVICVGAIGEDEQLAPFSNHGVEMDLVAPGVDITTTGINNSIVNMTGTSIAVPHVAGVAAQIWQANAKLTNIQLRTLLYNSAIPLGEQATYGWGLVNSEIAYYQKDQDFDIPILFEPPTIVTPEEPEDDGTVTASAVKIFGDYQTISAGEWAMTILQFDSPHANCYVEVYNPYGSRIHREYIGSVQAFNNVSHIWYTSTSTPPGTYKIRYDVGNQWPTEFTVYVQAPQLNITLGPYPSGAITTTSATIYWATNYNSDSVVYYGTTPNLGSYRYGSGYTTSHSVGLTGLLPGTTYYYMVQSSANGQTVNSGINSFTTKSSLEIYQPTVSNITANSATISWYSNMSATGHIEYSKYYNFVFSQGASATSGTYHYGALTGLEPNTTYYYKVSSYADGVIRTLGPYTFTTGTSLNITSGPNHSNISSNSATITWATNVDASSIVEYGTSSLNQTQSLSGTRKTHSVNLSGLKPSTTYQYRVKSVYNGVTVTSPIGSFTTKATIPSDKISERDDDTIDPNSTISDPVDAATGAQLISLPMLTVQGAMPIDFTLSYNSLLLNEGPLGKAWGHNFETRLEQEADGNIRIHWTANKRNTFTPTGGNVYTSSNSATRYDKLVKNVDNTFTLIRKDQSRHQFNSSGQCTQYGNGHGQVLNIQYDANGRVSKVTEPISGKYMTFSYNASDLLDRVSDNAGRQVSFTYNGTNLTRITDPNGKSFVYTHDGAGRIVTGTDGDNKLIFTNTFDAQGRVASQDDNIPGNQLTTFTYDELSEPGKVITTVRERNGSTRVLTHDSDMQLVKLVDELGYITTYTYDADGNRISETNAKNQTTLFSYDNRGNLLTITDPAGHVTTMTYDEHNNLLSMQNAGGKSYVYTYDSNNNLLAMQDPLGKTTQYTYENGLLKTQTLPRGGTITYTYENGLVKTITSPEGTSITYGYDATGNITSITDGAGKTTTMQYDGVGNLLQVSDPLGNTLSYTYNSRGQILTETDANNNTTRYEYNGNGKLQKVINALNQATTYEYDAEDRLIRVTDGRNNSTTFDVDAKGRTTGATDALGRSVSTEYDPLNNVTVQKDAYNRSIMSVSYDDLNNPVEVTDALGNTITRRYDNLNRLVEVIDALGRSTGYNYDGLNRLVSAVNALGGQSSQSYDEDGNINQISDANGNRTSYVYDLSDRVISQTTSAGKTLTYQYDNSRDLLSNSTNGRGQVTTYQYDAAGRLISYTDPDGTVSFTYDANGNVLTMSDNAGTVSYTYDALNRVSSYTDVYGNTIGYTYDAESNLTALTYPGNKTVGYSYDAANQLISVTDWLGRSTGYSYDNNGLLTTTARPDGSVETRTYDAAGRLTQIRDVKADGTVINQFDYTYDAAGNIISEDGAVISDEKLKLPSSIEQTFGADNRLSTFNGEPVVYDADGNMTTGPLQGEMVNYQYDSQNRLISVGDTSYSYDAANNRIAKSENGVITRYVVNPNAALSQLLMETDENGTAKAYYIYGIGLVGKIDVNGNKYYSYHFDNRGNTVALTDETGEVTDRYSYEPYGEIIQKIGETENCFLYVGQYGVMAENNGLYYMRARYYNPEIKAFINEDTVIGNVADTLSLNRYAYGSNNPLRYIDPTGHVSVEIASQIIKDNSQYIIDAAARYGVDSAIVAGCIYVEQVTNVDWIDTAGDRFYFLDTSIGVGQVKISTARLVEDMGYIGVTRSYKNYGNRIVVSREEAIYEKLMDNETNINYVAAYLSYWQDVWTEVFPQISKRADILGTLYNLGERANPPNPTPKANPFGINVGLAYGYMKHLLEIK